MISTPSSSEAMGKSETEANINGSPPKTEDDENNYLGNGEISEMNNATFSVAIKDEPMSCSSSSAANEESNELQQEELISQTRTSARVSLRRKEERKESEGSEECDTQQCLGQCNGDPIDTNEQGNFMDVDGSSSPASHSKKAKRAWELWSSEDKNHFFEALNECGKNFDAMQQSFQTKKFRKNKEQIRTFYYRTWHKISKYIDFPKDLKIKKSCCELYGLCNYGVLRKKLHGSQLDDKYGANLQQLIFEGHTTVRVRGRMYRLKTPTCAALKKMKDLESGLGTTGNISKSMTDFTIPNLPEKITLKLEPNCYETFVYVNKATFSNPKVCITVSIQRRLSSVISYLERKWRPFPDNRPTDEINNDISSKHLSSNSYAYDSRIEKFVNQKSDLWIQARESPRAAIPSMQMVEPITSASLSLSQLQCKNSVKLNSKNNNNIDSISKAGNDIKPNSHNTCSSVDKIPIIHTPIQEKDDLKSETLSIENNFNEGSKSSSENDTDTSDNINDIKTELDSDSKPFSLQDGLKKGWNATTASSVTVGELFLMLGTNQNSSTRSSNVIELTYDWRLQTTPVTDDINQESITKNVSQSSNGNLKSIEKVTEDKNCLFPNKSAKHVLSYLATFTASEMSRKLRGRLCNRNSPINSSTKGIILADSQIPGNDIYQTVSSEKQALDNGGLIIKNDTVSSTVKDRLVSPILNESSSKVGSNPSSNNSNIESFRRPIDPPLRNLNAQQQQQREMFRQQLDLLVPKYTQRKGRPLMRSKNIISRQLPLQPKLVPQPLIKTLNGNLKIRLKSNQQHPVQLLHQNSTVFAIKEAPISIKVSTQASDNLSSISSRISGIVNGDIEKDNESYDGENINKGKIRNKDAGSLDEITTDPVECKTTPEKNASEDDNLSLSFHNEDSLGSLSFLNDSTASNSGILHFRPPSAASDNAMYDNSSSKMNGDSFLDSVLEVSNGARSVLQTPPIHRSTSPPSSPPSNHLNGTQTHSWLPELSLTSFLNNFGASNKCDFSSPSNNDLSKSSLKFRHASGDFVPHLINEDSQQSTGSEVDRQLLSMMTENSVDFTSKFEKLASAVTNDTSANT